MADLRVHTIVDAQVDEQGDGVVHRTWELTNLTQETLLLSNFYLYVEVNSRTLTVQNLTSTPQSNTAYSIREMGLDKTRIECDFDIGISPGEIYRLNLIYSHPAYFTELRKSNAWILVEAFERFGPFTDVDFQQEEPQQIEFRLCVKDPRKKRILNIRSPLEPWVLESPQQLREEIGDKQSTLIYRRGLYSTDKSPDIHVLSSINSRTKTVFVSGLVPGLISLAVRLLL